MSRYEEYQSNLDHFCSRLPITDIRFLTYVKLPNETGLSPFVEDKCYRWTVDNVPCFLRKGISGNGWCYVYRESALKRMVTPPSDGSVVGNFGDHTTFAIMRKWPDNILLNTHYTTYEEDDYTSNIYHSILPVESTVYIPVSGDLVDAFDPLSVNIAHVYLGTAAFRPTLDLQDGGMEPLQYRHQRLDDAVLAFFKRHYLDRVCLARGDMTGVCIIYDARSQLGPNSNRNLLVVYEFEEHISVFYIDVLFLLKAYFAEVLPGEATGEERTCLQQFLGMAQQHVPLVVAA